MGQLVSSLFYMLILGDSITINQYNNNLILEGNICYNNNLILEGNICVCVVGWGGGGGRGRVF